jgi:Flp pilus assembly protein TadG
LPETGVGRAAPLAEAPRRAPRAPRRLRLSLDPRGQSLVEFAISFPVLMLMILFGIDFGRVFLGWITLNNTVREAANYAAINPAAWTAPENAAAQAEYARLITSEAAGINCTLPTTLPRPSFPSGTTIGSPATVAISCKFSLITPLISSLLGNQVNVSASAAFPIRSGLIAGTGYGGGLASFVPVVPTPSPFASVTPTATPFPTPSAIPTAPPMCVVPDFYNTNTRQATRTWTNAGFAANNLSFNPLVPPNYKIKTQIPAKGSVVLCSSTGTVAP